MSQSIRVFWQATNANKAYNFNWPPINANSVVLVTASEYDPAAPAGRRRVGKRVVARWHPHPRQQHRASRTAIGPEPRRHVRLESRFQPGAECLHRHHRVGRRAAGGLHGRRRFAPALTLLHSAARQWNRAGWPPDAFVGPAAMWALPPSGIQSQASAPSGSVISDPGDENGRRPAMGWMMPSSSSPAWSSASASHSSRRRRGHTSPSRFSYSPLAPS